MFMSFVELFSRKITGYLKKYLKSIIIKLKVICYRVYRRKSNLTVINVCSGKKSFKREIINKSYCITITGTCLSLYTLIIMPDCQ